MYKCSPNVTISPRLIYKFTSYKQIQQSFERITKFSKTSYLVHSIIKSVSKASYLVHGSILTTC